MSVEDLQKRICVLIAAAQKSAPGGYLAGGIALQESLKGDRLSEDIDRFHDSDEEVAAAFARDTQVMIASGLRVEIQNRYPSFIRTLVTDERGDSTWVDWARDSAWRFFPLEDSPEFGRTLSRFDLATNKTLAMVGRLEIRDWIDMMLCHDRIQPLGLLAYAACGKDEGYSPSLIVEMGARSTRYAADELAQVRFRSKPPSLAALHRKWHGMIDDARRWLKVLPPSEAGKCVMRGDAPFRGSIKDFRAALKSGKIFFRAGHLESVLGIPKPALIFDSASPEFDPS